MDFAFFIAGLVLGGLLVGFAMVLYLSESDQ